MRKYTLVAGERTFDLHMAAAYSLTPDYIRPIESAPLDGEWLFRLTQPDQPGYTLEDTLDALRQSGLTYRETTGV